MRAAVDPPVLPAVLVLGRDPVDRARLADILTESAFATSQVSCPEEAASLMSRRPFDLVVVDDDGAPDLWRGIAAGGLAPVLLLADSAGVIERIIALELGVDAVLPKPVHNREMLSTAKAVIRRSRRALATPAASVNAAAWKLDPELRRFTGPNGQTAPLSPSELALLKLFLDRPGLPVSAERVEGPDGEGGTASRVNFRVTLARLRRRLEQAGYPADAIRTVRGVGYVFLPDEIARATPETRPEPARSLEARGGRALH